MGHQITNMHTYQRVQYAVFYYLYATILDQKPKTLAYIHML